LRNNHKRIQFTVVICFIALIQMGATAACSQASKDQPISYVKTEHMVAMRDGIKLYTQVYAPKNTNRCFPVILFRTPYSIGDYGPQNGRRYLGPNHLYAPEGFIFVYQDVRGKFQSEGEFLVMRPHKRDKQGPQDTDESSDTYDTIAWILKQFPNNNGRVGQWGISYPGFQTVMGMIEAHPALKASSPQASPADMWIGDDFHHNGAFRLMYTFGWLAGNAVTRIGPTQTRSARFDYGTTDGYKFFLELGPVANVDKKYFHNSVPTWNEYMENGDYNEYWEKQDVLQHLHNINHAILNVAGWFDAEDFYGPMSIYYTIEKNNPVNQNILVVGPWRHGGWAREHGNLLGNIRFNSPTSEYFRTEVEFPFFLHHLKDIGKTELPEAIVFETGTNQWRKYAKWPPINTQEQKLFLHAGGQLSFAAPAVVGQEALDSFVSDPSDPVPYSADIGTSQGHTWMIEDQRFAAVRPDVLVYQTEILEEDIIIAGPIIADLFVATTGTDADWIVKLIDVFPENSPEIIAGGEKNAAGNFQMLVGADVFRGKYRRSYKTPEPFVPGEITRITYDLRDKYHNFRKGHRIMVHIQSTWFPLIDRNPQKFTNIYRAQAEDFQKATHRVYRSAGHSTHIKLLVLNLP